MTIHSQILKSIQSHPQGITCSELMSQLNITKTAVYTHIYHLRSKQKEPIIFQHFKYFYKTRKGFQPPTIIDHQPNGKLDPKSLYITDIINHKGIITSLKELDSGELEDALALIQKSTYYALSASAVVQSKRLINNLRQSIT